MPEDHPKEISESPKPLPCWAKLLTAIFLIFAVAFLVRPFEPWRVAFLLMIVAPLLCLLLRGRSQPVGVAEASLILALVALFLIGFGPVVIRNKLDTWASIFEDRLKTAESVSIPTPFGPLAMASTSLRADSLKLPANLGVVEDQQPSITSVTSTESQIVLAQRQPLNVIRNGDFLIPMNSPLNAWGHGQYTDRMHAGLRRWDFVWINFLNAEVDAQIVKTEIGPALRIENKTGNISDRVGIMEQYISYEPGTYQLSFRAKGEKLELNALFCATTDRWEKWHLPIPQKTGTFPWTIFETKIQMNGSFTTFTIVSKGRGILYLTDISLVRIGN